MLGSGPFFLRNWIGAIWAKDIFATVQPIKPIRLPTPVLESTTRPGGISRICTHLAATGHLSSPHIGEEPEPSRETSLPLLPLPLPLLARVLPACRQRTRVAASAMEPTSSSAVARQTWELENNIPAATTDPDAMDAIYRYDEAANARAHQEKPWATDPHHFRRARISALALLKMVVHARAGGTIEIMGLMQGKFEGDSIIVMDAFALPVEGTETRVNAQADAYEYMVEYSTINKQVQRPPNPSSTASVYYWSSRSD